MCLPKGVRLRCGIHQTLSKAYYLERRGEEREREREREQTLTLKVMTVTGLRLHVAFVGKLAAPAFGQLYFCEFA